jgi:hypothetical protein
MRPAPLARLDVTRFLRSQVEAIAKRLNDAGLGQGIDVAAKQLTGKLDAIDNQLHQPKSQASQDILNYPPRLDEIANLLGVVGSAPGAPTSSDGGAARRAATAARPASRRARPTDRQRPACVRPARAGKEVPVVIVPKEPTVGSR